MRAATLVRQAALKKVVADVRASNAILARMICDDFDKLALFGNVDAIKTLGDVEGHEFHGNQWTEGSGITEEVTKSWRDSLPPSISKYYAANSSDMTNGHFVARLEVNKELRTGYVSEQQQRYGIDVAGTKEALDAATTTYAVPLQQDTVVYRGVDKREASRLHRYGSELVDKGFTFVSTSRTIAEKYAKKSGAVVKVVLPKGTKVAYGFDDQRELILSRNFSWSKFRAGAARKSYPYKHIHRAADAYHDQVSAAIKFALNAAKNRADWISKSSDMTEKTYEPALHTMERELERRLPPILQKVYFAAGHAATKVLQKQLRNAEALRTAKAPSYPSPLTGLSFDETNVEAVKWAMKRSGDLISDVSKTTRDRIREAIVNGFSLKMDVDEVAREIDDIIDDPVRAELIARTETMSAANAGQREAWDQAVDKGFLSGDEKQVWIVTPDDTLCPICESMDGQKETLGDPFDVDGQEIDGPPAHPNCRCTTGLAF
jgi:hypothetical protein